MKKSVAFLLHNYFEQAEYVDVKNLLEDKGYATTLITTNDNKTVQGMNQDIDKADTFAADLLLSDANTADYDAIVLPGGTVNADTIRVNRQAQQFVTDFMTHQKPIAAICHAPWLLINSGLTKGRTLTAYHSLQTDIENSGGKFVDSAVQQDGNIITSRNPDDITAFVEAIDMALT